MDTMLQTARLINIKRRPVFLKNIIRNKMAYLFLLPILVLLATIKYYPFFVAIIKSMYTWNGANVNKFIGLENYMALFQDKYFYISMGNILVISVATILINLSMPLMAAVLVFNLRNEQASSFFKIGFIVPMVVPMMVIILLWKWIYAGDYGILNQLLRLIGLESLKHAWLGDTSTALGAIIFINFPWIGGLPFLIYLAGLQAIPKDLFEVSKIDGVSTLQRLLYIELPLILSQMKLVVMYMLIHAFQVFEQPFILTGGGPGTATLTPALYLYDQGFTYSRLGYASSIGVVIFVVILILTFMNQIFLKNSDKLD
ncbi:MAG: hypothetical protein A2Y21_11190 [Clostridiales bacterium GWC2_40_7]|nr:MAG: hypothetical protein A2Y21_11190 [Clostridiales bacterium GWC2_40_7]